MRTAVLLLCLDLVRDSIVGVVVGYFNLADQKVYPKLYEEFQDMLIEEQKIVSGIQDAKNNSRMTRLRKPKTRPQSESLHTCGSDNQTSIEALIALQEKLTFGFNATARTRYVVDLENVFNDTLEITNHLSKGDKLTIRAAFAYNKRYKKLYWKNAIQLIEENHYWVEKHRLKTEDGYYITLFRMKLQQGAINPIPKKSERPVVLLIHGLLGSADDWLVMGPNKSLAYQMLEAGFDVWLGNLRGSRYSKSHASKHHAHPDFWHFSVDELAVHDLPDMINYTLTVSREEKLFYVGHSLGTTAFFAMVSSNPEYGEKIAMMHAMSPMVYMNNVRSPLIRMISPKSRYYETIRQALGHGQLKPNKQFLYGIGGTMYKNIIGSKFVGTSLKFVISGVDSSGMDIAMMPQYVKFWPVGVTARMIKHYGQTKANKHFRKYNYGTNMNRKMYGRATPPKYDMRKVTVPIAIYYAEEDLLTHPKDVERLHADLLDVRHCYKVPQTHFSHMDFIYSEAMSEVINYRIIDCIRECKGKKY